ncbi:hypothetical protein DPMN_075319 [Dreissena polymorpha]|uniref:Uncharacterized protein n=1 Tax=Dreissena polymorpha TaxID=45954 RepID=A0A9D3YK54_DREPO|nr:hypothetical protein DPMN_075319 [Dreissena polymorpha]
MKMLPLCSSDVAATKKLPFFVATTTKQKRLPCGNLKAITANGQNIFLYEKRCNFEPDARSGIPQLVAASYGNIARTKSTFAFEQPPCRNVAATSSGNLAATLPQLSRY